MEKYHVCVSFCLHTANYSIKTQLSMVHVQSPTHELPTRPIFYTMASAVTR